MKFRLLFLLSSLLGTCLLANLNLAQVNQAKAATVLIETKRGEGYGSGFCISTDGLVVTNYHVIEDIPAKQIRAILHPGEPNQQTFRAEVLRQNKDMDLALLRLVVVTEPLTFLELGETTKLFETAQLTAFGYPFGKSLAVSKDAYPGVSVNVGKVTSLRRLRDGTLCEIQMDVLVNPGNSGGPVLGPDGKVVGVTVRGIPGSGVNFAIPVDQLNAFLMTPELLVDPVPAVPWDKRFEPVNLQIKAVCLVPLQGKLECRAFLLSSADPRPMTIAETEPGSGWTATAPLLEPPVPDAPVKVTIETADGTFTTSIPNRTIGFLFKSVQTETRWELRDLKEIIPGQSATPQFGDVCRYADMQFTGLEPLTIQIAGQDIAIPADSVKSLRVLDKVPVPPGAGFRVALTLDGEEWASQMGIIAIQPPAGHQPTGNRTNPFNLEQAIAPTTAATPAKPEAKPAPPAPQEQPEAAGDKEGRREVKLPARFTDCIRAGGGRYLLLAMPSLSKVAVFDLAKKGIAGYIPLLDANSLVAGGGEAIFVANPSSGVLERWSIATLERERRVSMPIQGTIYSLTMGADGDGPLLAIHRSGSGIVRTFIDARTFAPMEVETRQVNTYHPQYPPTIRAADCGTVFGAWVQGLSPSGLEIYTLTDSVLTAKREHTSVGHILPGPNGDYVYTGTGGIYTSALVPTSDCPRDVRCFIPSSHPSYYLGLAMSGPHYMRGGDTRISIFVHGLATPVMTLPPSKDVAAVNVVSSPGILAFEKRYHLCPQLRLLAILPTACESIVIQELDIEQSLRKREIDFLFVESSPPRTVRRGTTFRYQIVACTSARKITFTLDAGPAGMTISPTGELSWEVPPEAEAAGGVIVRLETDDDQSIFHSFTPRLVP